MTKKDSVGYRRPPKHSQFRKGQSGNPDGRPRRARKSPDADALEPLVTVTVNGKRHRVEASHAVYLKAIERALADDPVARKHVLSHSVQLARLRGPEKEEKDTYTLIIQDPRDALLIRLLLALDIIEEIEKGRYRLTDWAREAAEARRRTDGPPRLPPPR